jgi:hypothetical protein
MKPKSVLRSDLVPVGRALQAWRRNRPHRRQPIPGPLWKQIAALARRHGVSAVSRALRLDYYALKRRAAAQPAAEQFVEVPVVGVGNLPPYCTAELVDAHGRKLLLRWSCAPGPELAGLVQVIWNRGA